MATITEDYCSFEVAKLLKEKGFTEECVYFYDWYKESESYHICSQGGTCNMEEYPDEYSMPTHQMAMKWLREVHNLWCEISPEGKGLWYTEIYSLIDEEYIPNSNSHKNESYEEACEKALKYCLENLI